MLLHQYPALPCRAVRDPTCVPCLTRVRRLEPTPVQELQASTPFLSPCTSRRWVASGHRGAAPRLPRASAAMPTFHASAYPFRSERTRCSTLPHSTSRLGAVSVAAQAAWGDGAVPHAAAVHGTAWQLGSISTGVVGTSSLRYVLLLFVQRAAACGNGVVRKRQQEGAVADTAAAVGGGAAAHDGQCALELQCQQPWTAWGKTRRACRCMWRCARSVGPSWGPPLRPAGLCTCAVQLLSSLPHPPSG